MRITDMADLFYPDRDSRERGSRRRSELKGRSRFMEDLMVGELGRAVSLMGTERFTALAEELCREPEVIGYRLDCLTDILEHPGLLDQLRGAVTGLEGKAPEKGQEDINSFYLLKERIEELEGYLKAVEDICGLYRRVEGSLRSEALRGLFGAFMELRESVEFKEIGQTVEGLRQVFSRTIRSVRIGVNFDANMVPRSAGVLEVGYDYIRPRGNVLERLVFGDKSKKEDTFEGEEHLNSLVMHTPVDIDTALFRELTGYTREYALRVSGALERYRESLITDLGELIQQLDYYQGAAAFVGAVRARGLPMCRPQIVPPEERRTELRGCFDPIFYRKLSAQDHRARLEGDIVLNDLELGERGRIWLVTGANNGGKTTFARAVGLCQLMGQMGLYVPAEAAVISPCDGIFTHFPRDEQAGIDTSRFTTEIKELRELVRGVTGESLVILNESLQSTTPEECLEIAGIHLELLARAGVRGLYVTHLTGLYRGLERLNGKGFPSRVGSLVSVAEKDGRRLYRMTERAPLRESLAMSIYQKYGATEEDLT